MCEPGPHHFIRSGKVAGMKQLPAQGGRPLDFGKCHSHCPASLASRAGSRQMSCAEISVERGCRGLRRKTKCPLVSANPMHETDFTKQTTFDFGAHRRQCAAT